jgi:uncharacterized protein YgbK (DUF1537 family)
MHAAFVVADDLTGANDSAGRLAQAGLKARVMLAGLPPQGPWPEALLLNIQSRGLAPSGALAAARQAWLRLGAAQARLRYAKLDSTLRGNLAAEVEGMLAGTGAGEVAFVPAYPAQGRSIRKAELWVQGKRLDKSEYARDPLNPARCHRVDRLFPGLATAHVGLKAVGSGPAALKARLLSLRLAWPRPRVITFDCESDQHLDSIARATLAAGVTAWAGASGLLASLARALMGPRALAGPLPPLPPRLLVLAGTLSATTAAMMGRAQAGLSWGRGHLEPRDILAPGPPQALLKAAFLGLQQRGAYLAQSAASREAVEGFIRLGRRQGLSRAAAAEAALKSLARVGEALAGQPHVVLLTGGATAEAYLSLRGVQSLEAWAELAPGLPLARGVDSRGRGQWLLSKPGGFGQEGLLMDLGKELRIGGAPWQA